MGLVFLLTIAGLIWVAQLLKFNLKNSKKEFFKHNFFHRKMGTHSLKYSKNYTSLVIQVIENSLISPIGLMDQLYTNTRGGKNSWDAPHEAKFTSE